MTTVIYGASDDLIEVEGDLREEFTYRDDKNGDLLGFSDGTLLRVRYDADGIWRITPVRRGTAFQGIEHAPEDDDSNYTDRASLGDVDWVLHGSDYTSDAR